MPLEAIRKFLTENGKNNPELSLSHIDDAIEAAKVEAHEAESKRFIAEAKKIREDIGKLKPFKTALEEVGYDGTVELPAFIESLKKTKEEVVKGGEKKTELERQLANLGAQLKSLSDESKAAKEREATLQKERKTAIMKEKLAKDIGEKLAGGEAYVKSLIYEDAVDLDADGTIVFKQGDVLTPYNDGVKKFLKLHEADLKDNQRRGAESGPSKGIPKVSDNMSLTDMMRLPVK